MLPQLKRSATAIFAVTGLILIGLSVGLMARLWTAPTWVNVETHGCVIKFPQQPVHTTSIAPDPWSGERMDVYRVELEGATYQLDEIEADAANVTNNDLARFIAATATALGGALDPESRPADFRIRLGEGSQVRGRMYAVRARSRIYRLLVAKKSSIDSPDVTLFLDSFTPTE